MNLYFIVAGYSFKRKKVTIVENIRHLSTSVNEQRRGSPLVSKKLQSIALIRPSHPVKLILLLELELYTVEYE